MPIATSRLKLGLHMPAEVRLSPHQASFIVLDPHDALMRLCGYRVSLRSMRRMKAHLHPGHRSLAKKRGIDIADLGA